MREPTSGGLKLEAFLTVRPITRYEAELFASAGPDPERTQSVLVQLWDECRSCPEWCFVGEENGRVVARIGFWILPSIITTFHIGWLTLPWDSDYLSAGREFWKDVLERIRGYGASDVESAIDSDQDHHDQRLHFYEHIDLPLIQEKAEYKLRTDDGCPKPTERLQFRTMAEEGEPAFIDAIRRVTEGTLDREDRDVLRTEDPAEAAKRYFGILKDIDYTPERWQLGYAEQGSGVGDQGPGSHALSLVGLIAPQKFNDDVGAINYIGVVPELRGKGYVNDLMARGVQLLCKAGVKQVIASIDTLNYPVIAAAKRAGFRHDINTLIYRLTLSKAG